MLAAFSVRLSGLERPIENVGLESGLPSTPDMSPRRTNGRYVPTSDLCVDGDLGLTTRSEAALEPPRFSYAHWQAYICPSSSLVIVPGLHPDALRTW